MRETGSAFFYCVGYDGICQVGSGRQSVFFESTVVQRKINYKFYMNTLKIYIKFQSEILEGEMTKTAKPFVRIGYSKRASINCLESKS